MPNNNSQIIGVIVLVVLAIFIGRGAGLFTTIEEAGVRVLFTNDAGSFNFKEGDSLNIETLITSTGIKDFSIPSGSNVFDCNARFDEPFCGTPDELMIKIHGKTYPQLREEAGFGDDWGGYCRSSPERRDITNNAFDCGPFTLVDDEFYNGEPLSLGGHDVKYYFTICETRPSDSSVFCGSPQLVEQKIFMAPIDTVIPECFIDADCTDNNIETIDTCVDTECKFETIITSPIECIFDSQCDDDITTTLDTCENTVCKHQTVECTVDFDCDTGFGCATNICIPAIIESTTTTQPSGNGAVTTTSTTLEGDEPEEPEGFQPSFTNILLIVGGLALIFMVLKDQKVF